jgi:hypothetical protein
MNNGSNGSWATDRALTSGTGTAWAPLPSVQADEVTIQVPATGTTIEVGSAGATYGLLIAPGGGVTITVAASAAEVRIRRADQSNTPAEIRFLHRKANF